MALTSARGGLGNCQDVRLDTGSAETVDLSSSFSAPKKRREEEIRLRGMIGSVGSGFTEIPLRLSGNDTYTFDAEADRAEELLSSCASSCVNKPPRDGFVSTGALDASTFGCAIHHCDGTCRQCDFTYRFILDG